MNNLTGLLELISSLEFAVDNRNSKAVFVDLKKCSYLHKYLTYFDFDYNGLLFGSECSFNSKKSIDTLTLLWIGGS